MRKINYFVGYSLWGILFKGYMEKYEVMLSLVLKKVIVDWRRKFYWFLNRVKFCCR